MALTTGQKLYLAATNLIGVHEKPGPDSNPLILSWIRRYFGEANDDSLTAWCGIGMAIFFRIVGMYSAIPKFPYKAQAWKDIGREVTYEEARQGDIVVMWRKSKKSGLGHVTLLDEKDPDGDEDVFNGLGANQKNTIRVNKYSKKRILTIRRID